MLSVFRQYFLILFSTKREEYRKWKRLIGYVPSNVGLFNRAMRHNSASKKIPNAKIKNSNERLEFLGDAILDMVIAEELFRKYPNSGEGFLTEMRSKVVSRKQLSNISRQMGLIDILQISESLKHNRHALQNVGGNALEALIGAIFLDRGYGYTKKIVLKKIIKPYVDFDELKEKNENFKSLLYHHVQKEKQKLEFNIVEEDGSAHRKKYLIAAVVDGKTITTGSGFSKKIAEQQAAEKACIDLGLLTKKSATQ